MADLEGLARWPEPPFTTKQFSSRDRLSDDPNHPETWFANQDRGNCLYDGVVKADTPYFKEPQPTNRRPGGVFPKGTRIGLARHRTNGDHVWAYATAPDGGLIEGRIPQGFIPRSALQPNPEGHVLAEMEGPGCLVRFWSANPSEAGRVRIYLDHAPEPIIDGRLQDLLGGTWGLVLDGKRVIPFPKPLAGERGQGWTLLFPLPYQKHCKVVVEKPELAYQIGYRTYPPGTTVATFSWELWRHHQTDITDLADYFARRPGATGRKKTAETSEGPAPPQSLEPKPEVTLEPGSSAVLRTFLGSGCLERCQFRLTTEHPAQALRGLLLTAHFDEAEAPQICCPLGDFFGTSPGANPYHAEPLSVSADLTLVSHWRMPFARRAVLTLTNHSRHRVRILCETAVVGYAWNERSLHFHAQWRFISSLPSRPFRDVNLCRLQGQGVYVGTMLSVLNPVSAWWGEGDDKMYVDGESFPSLFGTATEEHFGFAFGHRQPFHHPLHNLTRCDGPGHYGHTSMNRFLLLERIPFTKEFRFDLEQRHWTPNISLSWAATCYWYARPGATANFPPPRPEQLRQVPAPPALHRLAGAWEGEQLQILQQSSPFPLAPQDVVSAEGVWSNGAQLFAQPTKQGEWAELAVPITHRGKQRLRLHLTQGPQYGTVRFQVNGKLVNLQFQGYHAGTLRLAAPLELGTFDLEPGTLSLRIETVAAAPAAIFPRYAWGLDAVELLPVK
jgi:hypothetical protein